MGRALAFVLVMSLLLFAGLVADPIPQWFAGQDKLEHLLGSLCLAMALGRLFPRLGAAAFFATCVSVSVLIELAQTWEPHRTCSVADVLAGTLGTGLAWLWLKRSA